MFNILDTEPPDFKVVLSVGSSDLVFTRSVFTSEIAVLALKMKVSPLIYRSKDGQSYSVKFREVLVKPRARQDCATLRN